VEGKKMGLLANVVVANFSDAKAIEKSVSPVKTWEGFDASGLDPVKLDTSKALIQKESGIDEPDGEFQLLASDDEGPWVLGFPQRLTDSLAKFTPSMLLRITRHWLETDELQMDNWQLQDTRTLLTNMQCLAHKAIMQNKSLIIWISL
jgi:hypothetical protein